MIPALLIAIAVLALVATGVVALLQRQALKQRQAMEALAARRGWSLNVTNQSLGRPALLRMTSRGGPAWEARSRRLSGNDATRRADQVTEFTGAEPKWPAGYLFIGAAPATISSEVAEALADENAWIRSRIVGDGMGADLSGLTRFDGPTDIIIMATTEPRLRVPLDDMAKLWSAWTPQGASSGDYPVMLLGPDGLRLRLRRAVSTASEMEEFIDFAQAVGRTAGTGR